MSATDTHHDELRKYVADASAAKRRPPASGPLCLSGKAMKLGLTQPAAIGRNCGW